MIYNIQMIIVLLKIIPDINMNNPRGQQEIDLCDSLRSGINKKLTILIKNV